MQCASCHFENMPGVAICGQCGANLHLAIAPIDVNPPRARGWKKHLRRWLPIRPFSYRLRDVFSSRLFEFIRRLIPQRLSLPIFLRMIVPGWPQMVMGRTTLGQTMLRLYLGLLLLTVLFFGSIPGGVFFGLALSIHASSIVDVIWWGTGIMKRRIITALVCLFAVGAICYYPVIAGISQIVVSRNMTVDSGPLQSGDVLIYSPAAYWFREPAVGDIVIYRTRLLQFQGRRPNTFPGLYHLGTEDYIDRIIAHGGQKVRWEYEKLIVDGKPSQWQPLNPRSITHNLDITVPEGYYCILPSVLASSIDALEGIPPEILNQLSVVPRHMIQGRVILRNYPFTRLWWVR